MVEVRDDLLPASLTSALNNALAWVPMYHLSRIDRDPAAHPLDTFWYYPLAICDDPKVGDVEPALAELEVWARPVTEAWSLLRTSLTPRFGRLRLYDVEIAANSYGTEGHPHVDCPRPDWRPAHITAVIYCNPEWDLAWGGETLIFDEAGEVTHAVRPRPGRVTLIMGDPLHVARGVARLCPVPRRVLVFKMWQSDKIPT